MKSQTEFFELLNAELDRRKAVNKRYSLRAFARDLSIEPSLLSKMLRGQYVLTGAMVRRLGQHIGLASDRCMEIARNIDASRQIERDERVTRGLQYENLEQDHMRFISEWYYLAIVHLAETSDFKADVNWCAQRLSLPVDVVQDAIERLKRLGYLLEKEDGYFVSKQAQYSTLSFGDTSLHHRNLQKQVLEKAQVALEKIPFEKRHQSTLTFSVSSSVLPKIIREINTFRRHINAIAAESARADEVYNLSFSLYPVTSRGNK